MGGVNMEDKDSQKIAEMVLQEWMQHYRPGEISDEFILLLTSYEICEILQDFCPLEPAAVTKELLENHYKLAPSGEGAMKFIIKKI